MGTEFKVVSDKGVVRTVGALMSEFWLHCIQDEAGHELGTEAGLREGAVLPI